MEAVVETTGGAFPAHLYLLDGNTLVAYIRAGTTKPYYFKQGIKGFDKRGRTFKAVTPNPFKARPASTVIAVQGSRGEVYYVDPVARTCTCKGFQFRGTCKHLAEIG